MPRTTASDYASNPRSAIMPRNAGATADVCASYLRLQLCRASPSDYASNLSMQLCRAVPGPQHAFTRVNSIGNYAASRWRPEDVDARRRMRGSCWASGANKAARRPAPAARRACVRRFSRRGRSCRLSRNSVRSAQNEMRLPVFMLSEALRLIGATRTSLIGALGPVSALTMSAIGFDERLTGSQGFGAILVLSGVILISKSR